MEQPKEKNLGKPPRTACPVSVLSFIFCVVILIRVEQVHRQTVWMQDQFRSQQNWGSDQSAEYNTAKTEGEVYDTSW